MTTTGVSLSLRLETCSPSALRAPESTGASFHAVLQGACWLLLTDSRPLALGPSDVVLLPRGAPYVVADDPRTPPVDVPCLDGLPADRRRCQPGRRAAAAHAQRAVEPAVRDL